MKLRIFRPATTSVFRRAVRRLLFLMTLVSLLILPTTLFAEVVQVGNNVQMSGSDLSELVRQILENEAENKALREALESERASFLNYQEAVESLIAAQKQEREAFNTIIQKLERQLNRPRLEAYGGYNTNNDWEGGLRLVWVLK